MLKLRRVLDDPLNVVDADGDVDDRLGANQGNGSTPDVLNVHDDVAERLAQRTNGLLREGIPLSTVR